MKATEVKRLIESIAKDVLKEANLDVSHVDANVTKDALVDAGSDITFEKAHDVVVDFEREFIKSELTPQLHRHGIGDETWTENTVWDVIEDHNDQFVQLQMDCMEKVEAALNEHAMELSSLVVAIFHDDKKRFGKSD